MITERKTAVFLAVVLLVAIALAITPAVAKQGPPGGTGGGPPEGKGPGGSHEESAVNNLSFPVIAMDGFGISSVAESLAVPYAGAYPGLTAEQIAYLEANGPWYPQKTEGNKWAAEFEDQLTAVDVSFVNWGDNIESVNPALRRPFRLEVTLYKNLETSMTAYTMAELEYPSSSNELQGTNGITYESEYATIVSNQPKLLVQFLGTIDPDDLLWDETEDRWYAETGDPEDISVSFAPELNVGGRYIFGASVGGWKPDTLGAYRITFYIPGTSGVSLANADVDNFPPLHPESGALAAEADEGDEGGVATPAVVGDKNLTYVDVEVIAKGGGGGGKPNKP
jgi:hypothetical protein